MNFLKKLRAQAEAYEAEHNYTCDLCGREVFFGERVCAPCKKALPFHRLVCPLCGREVKEEGICLECKEEPPGVERARSVCEHEGEAMRTVVRFKRGAKFLARTLSELSLPVFLREFADAEVLVPVPMTAAALKKRGYNQSLLFAEALSKALGLPVVQAEKRKETRQQKFLGRKERAENLAGSFALAERESVRGKVAVIVDDTMTTGATASELARVLTRAGAKRVYLFTFTSVTKKNVFGVPPKHKK